jgi:hypothetical protein
MGNMTQNKNHPAAEGSPFREGRHARSPSAAERGTLPWPWDNMGHRSRAAVPDLAEQELLRKREAVLYADKLREETLYVIDLIQVLQSHPGGRRRWAVMQSIRKLRGAAHLPIADNFEQAVENAFHQHCVESGIFKKGQRPAKAALFHWPLGKTGGIWAVHPEAAQAWMTDHSREAEFQRGARNA